MAIPTPWESSETPSEAPNLDPNWGRERERDRAGARDYTADEDFATEGNVKWGPWPATADTDGDQPQQAEIVVRPDPGVLVKLGDASKIWGVEAWDTAKRGLDKTVWTERPASLRDMHVRLQRAEWAGDVKVIRQVGTALGYMCLVLTAVGRGALWPLARPARLLITTAIAVLIVVLAI